MKYFHIALLVVLSVSFASTYVVPGDGKPSCTNLEEVNIRIFRNNWDPTSYWKCSELNEAPVLERCPDETAFLDSVKDCVNWEEWQWEQPVEPQTHVEQQYKTE